MRVIIFLAILLIHSLTFASEAGNFGYKAKQLYTAGRYNDALLQLHKGLAASAKEANLKAENTILIDMAQILTNQYEYSFADSILNAVQLKELDTHGKIAWLLIKQRLYNQQNLFEQSAQIYKSQEGLLKKDQSDVLRALCMLEQAIALAGLGEPSSTGSLLKEAESLFDDEAPGLIFWTKARIAHLSSNKTEALDHYNTALNFAQAALKNWQSGQILLHMASIQMEQKNLVEAKALYRRSARLFQELSLDRPFLAAAEPLLVLSEDRELAQDLNHAKNRLNIQVQP